MKTISKGMVLLLVALLALGCGDDGGSIGPLHDALETNGVDVGALFAPPTTSELESMLSDWSGRQLGAVDLQDDATFTLQSGDTLRVLSHLVGDQRHYGAVIVPAGAHVVGSLGVFVSLIGFGKSMLLEIPPQTTADGDAHITLLPSFRGHTLRFGDQEWVSGGDAFDHCDGGTDDAIAFINAALQATPEATSTGMFAVGGSRGGNVALLIGIRKTSIAGVVDIVGPTDYLREELLEHPNVSPLYQGYFVKGLLDGTSDATEARRRLLACSPLYFAEQLPPTQVHHGTADLNVPFTQAELLSDRMAELGRMPPDFELFTYEGADHQLVAEKPQIETRVGAFINALRITPTPE